MTRFRRFLVAAIVSGLAGISLAAEPITMHVYQSIEGYVPMSGPMPVTVELRNEGPDAVGVVRVVGSQFQTDYPVELPQGSQKLLFTYPTAAYSEIRYVLQTNRGRKLVLYHPEMKWGQQPNVLLLVSDSPGQIAFLRSPETQQQRNAVVMQDAYCDPDGAPDRPVGYAGIGAVLLGDGAERLSDATVRALKLWTLTGGTLVFLGGASAPILNDPRWQEALPARNFRTRTFASRTLQQLGRVAPPVATMRTADPLPAAHATWDGSTLVAAEHPFGVGRVVYLAFNPLEAPLNQWEGRSAALRRLLRPVEFQGRRLYVSYYAREGQYAPYGGVHAHAVPAGGPPPPATGSTPVPIPSPMVVTNEEGDPFSAKLPPSEQIFLILGLYFVAVVPLNFLVLKKMGRGELAWFTAPILSLAFAGILFSQAQNLYSAQLSTASQGVLVTHQGAQEGVFVGTSQMFIPRGGSYDLKLTGVDSVGAVESDQYGPHYYGRDASPTLELDPVDSGEIHAPRMRANNLAFREITYRQVVPAADWTVIRPQGGGRYVVRNTGPYTLLEGRLWVGKRYLPLPRALAPGESLTVTVKPQQLLEDPNWNGTPSLGSVLGAKSLALTGKIEGFRPGPQIGAEVSRRSRIDYVFVSKEAAA